MTKLSLPRSPLAVSLLAFTALALVPLGAAQAADSSGGGWFVPKGQQQAAPPAAAPRHHAAPRPAPAPMPEEAPVPDAPQAPPVLPLPPVPAIPPIPKEAPPPAAAIGIISVPGVMQLSSAAQEIQQVLGARRDNLAHAVQKEEAAWRSEQQKLQMQARILTSDQIQLRERHLQERRARDQRDFGNKARIIQEAYQVAFHQIERALEQRDGVIARVAAAHGMNLIFHAQQVILHVDGQDITEEVATRLNAALPHVFIPDENVDPETLAKSGKMPTTADEERLARQAPPSSKAPAPAKPAH